MLRKKLAAIIQFAFFLGLGLFLVWWMMRGIDEAGWQQIKNSWLQAKYWLFFPVFFVLLASHYVRALRWKLLMEPLGYSPSNANVFNAVMVGYLANLAFPRLGEVLKCTILAKYEKAAPDKLIGTIVAERAIDLMSLLLVFFITIFSQLDVVGNYAAGLLQNYIAQKGAGWHWQSLLITAIASIAIFSLLIFVAYRLRHKAPFHKLWLIGRGIGAGLVSIRYVRKKGLFLLYSLLIWILYYTAARMGFYAMDEVAHLGYKEALSILFFGSIGMIVTQGGLGAYAYAVQETLSLYGIDQLIGFTFGWLLWIAQTGVLIIGGLVSMLLLPIMNRKSST